MRLLSYQQRPLLFFPDFKLNDLGGVNVLVGPNNAGKTKSLSQIYGALVAMSRGNCPNQGGKTIDVRFDEIDLLRFPDGDAEKLRSAKRVHFTNQNLVADG